MYGPARGPNWPILTPQTSPGTSWWPQEAITEQQAHEIAAAGHADTMFCHDCPAGIEVPGAARDRFGCPPEELARSEAHRELLRSIVDAVRPTRLWHGHFHHRYQALLDGDGYRTVIDGLGRNRDPIDNDMVVINLAQLGHHRLAVPMMRNSPRCHGPHTAEIL